MSRHFGTLFNAAAVAMSVILACWTTVEAQENYVTPKIATLDTSLMGWWKLDEKSGTTAYDSSSCGNHGKLINSPTRVGGRIGEALHFANTDDTRIYVEIPNSPTLENVQEGDYTVAAWVWPSSLPPGTEVTPAYGILVKEGYHIGLVYDQDGIYKMQHHSSVGYSLARTAKKSPGAWHHVTGVVSKSNGFVKIYVNGKIEATVNFSPGAAAREFGMVTWKLGIAGPGYTKYREAMTGKIDDARVYNRVLSDAEIAALAHVVNATLAIESGANADANTALKTKSAKFPLGEHGKTPEKAKAPEQTAIQ
jgi:hypothetical protein